MNAQPVVIVTSHKESPVDLELVRGELGDRANIRVVPLPHRKLTPLEEEDFINQMVDAVVIFQRPGFITRKIIEACPYLKFVITHGAGVDKIDLKACEERGVWVGNVPGENANAVAEQVVAGIIVLLRRLMVANTSMHRGGWKRGRFVGREFSEGTLGIIGFGNVGRRLAQIARGFGTRVFVYDPYLAPGTIRKTPRVTEYENLDDLLGLSDYVSIHVPLTKDTTKFIGLREFRLMKEQSILVNTSRGGVIDEEALCVALREGMIGGVVLDVFSDEPLPKNSPIRHFPNAVLTPHIGGSTEECLRRIARKACEEILLVLSGKKPVNLVKTAGTGIDLTSRA
jgi:phosphoglycerate dehydrogenase-like enzyme